ncbi:GOS9-like protein [Tanacetum coccineum]
MEDCSEKVPVPIRTELRVCQPWIFQLHDGWKLTKITVYYTEKDCIYSPIVFTYLDDHNIKQEKQVGGNPPTNALAGQVIIEDGEKITEISGTVGSYTDFKVITSLCFKVGTNKYGPYGPQNGTSFIRPVSGEVTGFYGTIGAFLDSLGVTISPNN